MQHPEIIERLSIREREVTYLVMKGLSNKEAAQKLYITEKTVKYHLNSVYKKLEVKNRTQLIIKYLRSEV